MDKKNDVIKYAVEESFGKHHILAKVGVDTIIGTSMGLGGLAILKGLRYLLWGDSSSGSEE